MSVRPTPRHCVRTVRTSDAAKLKARKPLLAYAAQVEDQAGGAKADMHRRFATGSQRTSAPACQVFARSLSWRHKARVFRRLGSAAQEAFMAVHERATTRWPLTGRDEELRQFAQVWADRRCRGVAIFGPPGVGKSRLAEECIARAGKADFKTGRATATAAAGTVPLGAIAHLL